MWVHNNIRHNPVLRKGHILVPVYHPDSPFLGATTSTFISNLRLPVLANTHFTELVAFAINPIIIHINISLVIRFHRQTAILICDNAVRLLRHHFTDDNIISIHIGILRNEAVVIQLLVGVWLQRRNVRRVRK